MRFNYLKLILKSPAFVIDERSLRQTYIDLIDAVKESEVKIIFPVKSNSILEVLCIIKPYVKGFAVSSVNEAKLLKHIAVNNHTVHFASPGIITNTMESILELCDYICFNSLTQFSRFGQKVSDHIRAGLRINTQLGFVNDDRYNPCRKHSKLGVPLSVLQEKYRCKSDEFSWIEGILFHSNCESKYFNELLLNVKLIDNNIPEILRTLKWINIGGGYLFDDKTDWKPFINAVNLLKSKYDLEVFFEPGKGIVGEAGYLLSSVVDLFKSDGKNIAILDTTVNHMPEVFEYQYRPVISQENKRGKFKYILAGCSCLAGDLFGEYRFKEPLEIGSKIVFEDMGAYTLAKANMFNGINLPSIYILRENGELQLVREYDYQDFTSIYGAKKHATLRERDPLTSNIWSNELT